MMGATLSPRAQRDVEEIWAYSAHRWGVDQAENYILQLGQSVKAIALRPTIGRPCPEIRAGYYKLTAGSHVLFYRRVGDGVDVVRILHARMDFSQHI